MTNQPEEAYSNRQIDPKDKVPIREKIAYGAGQVGVGIQEYADNQVLMPIFVIGMGVSPALMGILGVVYRIWDAFTDATMGWVTDNTRTRWGRRRPFLFVGAFLMAVAMPSMFLFNPTWDLVYITAWMIAFQLILTGTQTFYNIPYQCLMLEMTPDSNERTSISAFRSYFGILTGFFSGWTMWLCMQPIFQPENGEAAAIHGAPWVLGGFAIMACILGVMPAIYAKERFYEAAKKQEKVSIIKSMKLAFGNGPFVKILLFILLGAIGSGVVESIGGYLRIYYVCESDMLLFGKVMGLESTLRIFTSIGGVRFFQWLAEHTSKKKALMVAASLILIGTLSKFVFYSPENPYLSIIPIVVFLAPAISANWLLVMSMIGDVVDDEELNSRERLEGTFSAVFSWIQKVVFSLRSGISGFLVVWAGFDVKKRMESLTSDTVENMFLLLTSVPFVFVTIAIMILVFYPLSTQRIRETRAKLEARRGVI